MQHNRKLTRAEVEQEIQDILRMYEMIGISLNALSDLDKQSLSVSAKINPHHFQFEGFDMNDYPNEKHFFILKSWIENGRYSEYKGMYLNSHSSSTIRGYRKMLEVFNRIDQSSVLTLEKLIELAKIQSLYSDNSNLRVELE